MVSNREMTVKPGPRLGCGAFFGRISGGWPQSIGPEATKIPKARRFSGSSALRVFVALASMPTRSSNASVARRTGRLKRAHAQLASREDSRCRDALAHVLAQCRAVGKINEIHGG